MRQFWLVSMLAISALDGAAAQAPAGGAGFANPMVMLLVLGALALAPFVLIMLTSFVKVAVVLSILRNALGTQQVPPNQIITGLAFVLTIFIMTPVATRMYNAAGPVAQSRDIFSEGSVRAIFNAGQNAKEPLRQFLADHAHDKDRILFMELAARLDARNGQQQPNVDKMEFRIVIPSFVTSQLKEAFQAGFLIFVPFIIIDMVVANILLAMGMTMLSPVVVSLPFKLLLFVLVDGWYLIVKGLTLSYL